MAPNLTDCALNAADNLRLAAKLGTVDDEATEDTGGTISSPPSPEKRVVEVPMLLSSGTGGRLRRFSMAARAARLCSASILCLASTPVTPCVAACFAGEPPTGSPLTDLSLLSLLLATPLL